MPRQLPNLPHNWYKSHGGIFKDYVALSPMLVRDYSRHIKRCFIDFFGEF
jgi:hypothetical protein